MKKQINAEEKLWNYVSFGGKLNLEILIPSFCDFFSSTFYKFLISTIDFISSSIIFHSDLSF